MPLRRRAGAALFPRVLALGAIGLFSACYLYLCGTNRFNPSMHFAYAGGYDILHGSLPYRDFRTLIGPMLYLAQALFFRVFGESYRGGYLAHAALFNALAACCAYAVARRRTDRAGYAAAAGLLTGLWFYPVYMAHPWYDTDAFLYLVVATWLLYGRGQDDRASGLAAAAAGVCAALAFYTKQSQGALGIILLALALIELKRYRQAAAYAAAAAAALLAGFLIFSSWGGAGVFLDYFLVKPLAAGRLSFLRRPSYWLLAALAGALLSRWKAAREMPLLCAGMALGGAGALIAEPLAYPAFLLPLAVLPWLAAREDRVYFAALSLLQLGARLVSQNEMKLFWPFLGLFVGIASHAMIEGENAPRWLPVDARGARPLWTLTGLFLAALGFRVSYDHGVPSIFPFTTLAFAVYALGAGAILARGEAGLRSLRLALAALLGAAGVAALAVFSRRYASNRHSAARLAARSWHLSTSYCSIPAMKGVRMPRHMADSLDAFAAWWGPRRARDKMFFCYPDCAILYSLMGQRTPDSQLWFDPGFTFRKNDGTVAASLAALREQGVRTIVLLSTRRAKHLYLKEAPRLKSLLRERGRLALSTPDLDVYRLSR